MRGAPDIIVVGAGVAGATAAYFLSGAGHSVELVEGHHPAHGASGRNPGFLWLQTKKPGAPMQLALAGRAFADRLSEELGDFGFRSCGGLISFRDESVEPVARAFVADRVNAGLPVELIDATAARDLCPAFGPEVRGAV